MSHTVRMPLPKRMQAELVAGSVAINTLMLAMPIATLQIYDRVLVNPGGGTLMMLGLGVLGAIVIEACLRLSRSYITNRMAQAFEQQQSEALVAHVLASWVGPAQALHSGEYVQGLTAVARVKEYALQRLIALSVDIPYMALFLLLLGIIGGILVVVPLVAVALFACMVVRWGMALRKAVLARNAIDEARYGYMLEVLAGIHMIKAQGLEPRFMQRFRKLQLEAGKTGVSIAWLNHALASGGAMFSQMIVILVVASGTPLVMNGTLSMGGLIACVLLSGRLIQPLQHALSCWMNYQEYDLAQRQIGKISALPRQYFVAPHENRERQGSMECVQLGFRYEEHGPWVVHGVNFSLAPGEVVALGGGGSGHSTLLRIIAGILPSSEGQVRIDGLDPACLLPSELAHHVAYIPSEPVLLRGTIAQNISCFDTTMMDRALEIAQLIGLDQLIAQLPYGYETTLDGALAETIPPGFRQRISIARALLHKPRLILFDQADRSLDRDGYHQLFRLIARLKGKASVIIVSDDKNMIRLCDRHLALEDGRIQPVPGHAGQPGYLSLVRKAEVA